MVQLITSNRITLTPNTMETKASLTNSLSIEIYHINQITKYLLSTNLPNHNLKFKSRYH